MIKLLFVLLLLNMQCGLAQDLQIKISQQQIDDLDIKLGNLNSTEFTPLLYAPARVTLPADHEFLISSTQPGLIMQLLVNIGDSVAKGQVLAKINSPDLLSLQKEFLTAGSELILSEQALMRNKKLLAEGVIADRHWQETQTVYSNKSAQFNTARQLLIMAGMTVAEIKNLEQTRQLTSQLNMHSPTTGIVLDRYVSVGTRLDMQAPIYRIADLSELWLEINIPQERLNSIHVGDTVNIENSSIFAVITLMGQSVNQVNQTVLVRAAIKAKSVPLKVGQNVNVQVLQSQLQNNFKVENTAIAQYEGQHYIFVRNQDGFWVQQVTVIGKQDNDSIISASLTGKEQIAIKGSVALKATWLNLGNQ